MWINKQKFVDCNRVLRNNILSEINGFAKNYESAFGVGRLIKSKEASIAGR